MKLGRMSGKKELSSRKIKVYNMCLGSEKEVKVGSERNYF